MMEAYVQTGELQLKKASPELQAEGFSQEAAASQKKPLGKPARQVPRDSLKKPQNRRQPKVLQRSDLLPPQEKKAEAGTRRTKKV